jgi:hypothetical protein
VKVTRKQLLAGAAGSALGAAGVYELVDRLAGSPERAPAVRLGREQHLLEGVQLVTDNGVEVVVPPLHHEVVTARVRPGTSPRRAQAALERQLAELERRYPPTPAGLGVTVAWGLPYFRRYAADQFDAHVPVDLRASTRRRVPAVVDALRFPSDPHETVLEENDVAVQLRSDRLDHIAAGHDALFRELDVFEPTSIRKGFVGGGFGGRRSLPKRMATAAGVPGADLIPEHAQLFLGFTSTQRAGLGPPQIANFETLGYTDMRGGYFRGGTHMHLSHIEEDLEAWYLNFDFRERVDTAFHPRHLVREGTLTVPQAPKDVASEREVERDYRSFGTIGHSAAIQSSSRLHADHVAEDGTVYRKGTAIPIRADFNTLDNPFFWSAGGVAAEPKAGVHFVVFNPTSDDFHRNRLAMDGVLPDGTKLPFAPRARGQGFNSVLRTTHRQNFLVPPRAHRSFPLAELA